MTEVKPAPPLHWLSKDRKLILELDGDVEFATIPETSLKRLVLSKLSIADINSLVDQLVPYMDDKIILDKSVSVSDFEQQLSAYLLKNNLQLVDRHKAKNSFCKKFVRNLLK